MKKRYIIALDEGTTSARSLVYDTITNKIVTMAAQEFKQIYPKTGWVEHDPMEIWKAQQTTMQQVVAYAGIDASEIYGIGITNQRETVVAWDKTTGKPIYNAIVWQCRRTTEICEDLINKGYAQKIQAKTGLVIDAYFSATKIKWILDNVPKARELILENNLCVGTIDTFLIWNLTKGESFVTDVSNASRTMLFNINTLQWDDELLELLSIPKSILPKVVSCSEIVGHTRLIGEQIPICGIAGDQQAALFGQACFETGMAKNTYGTGCFILMNIGKKPTLSNSKLITTIAWQINGETTYALEGSVFNAGSSVQWIRDELLMIEKAADTERYANRVPDTNGVYVVPAFTGLGAPYWDMNARGMICGLTRGANKYHIVRAVLESMAYSSYDVMSIMEKDTDKKIIHLRCDGGASNNNFLMQFQSDILGVSITRPTLTETTGLGAVYLAGLASGAYNSLDEIASIWQADKTFEPNMAQSVIDEKIAGWHKAVGRSLSWLD